MSENELSLAISKDVENKKQAAWGKLGVQIYHTELRLQLRAQEIISKLIDPVTVTDIPASEEALKVVKKELFDLKQSRIAQTSKLEPVKERLMVPETSIDAAIEKNVQKIIKAKKEKEEEDKKEALRQKEIKDVAEKVCLYVADMHSAYLHEQANLLSTAYTYALEQNIQAGEPLEAYKTKIKNRITLKNRAIPLPNINTVYNGRGVIAVEINKHFNPWKPQQYIDGFSADVDTKFENWELALKNKEQAVALDKKELDGTVAAIEDLKQQETISVKLRGYATPVDTAPTKALKYKYEVDLPETMQNALLVINAFIVNQAKCLNELRIKNAFNLSVKQMINALEALKNDDENFSFTGIIFKQVEKL